MVPTLHLIHLGSVVNSIEFKDRDLPGLESELCLLPTGVLLVR